jgi:hypothetical protein
MADPYRPYDNIIRRMRFACWITTATDTHSEYVIFIAFRRQQWLRERALLLRYAYTACLVYHKIRNFKFENCCPESLE